MTKIAMFSNCRSEGADSIVGHSSDETFCKNCLGKTIARDRQLPYMAGGESMEAETKNPSGYAIFPFRHGVPLVLSNRLYD